MKHGMDVWRVPRLFAALHLSSPGVCRLREGFGKPASSPGTVVYCESALPKAVKFCSGIARAEPKVSSGTLVDRLSHVVQRIGLYDLTYSLGFRA